MALTHTGTGGFWTRQGIFAGALNSIRTEHKHGGEVHTRNTAILNQLVNITESGDVRREEDIAAAVRNVKEAYLQAAITARSGIQRQAQATAIRQVFRDKPQPLHDLNSPEALTLALESLYRDMIDASREIASHTVTATGAVSLSNKGTGTLLFSTKRGDGLVQEACWDETGYLRCTNDAIHGTAVSGHEDWTYYGQSFIPVTHPEFCTNAAPNKYGSGAKTNIRCCDPTRSNQPFLGGNILTNGGFIDWSSGANSAPDKWGATGTGGADWRRSATSYTGSYAFEFIGGTEVSPVLHQVFNDTTGTLGKLKGSHQYGFVYAMKADVVPASGVITIELTNSAGTVLDDDQGVANSTTRTLSALSTSYALFSVAFRTPKTLASGARLRFRVSTVIPAGSSIFLDHVGCCQLTPFYLGGPECGIFGGATAWIEKDLSTITVTNDYGGASHRGASFQTYAADVLGCRERGILLPSGSDISNTLITA